MLICQYICGDMMLTTRAKKLPPHRGYYLRQIKLFKSICGDMMFLLTKRKEIMPPHRGGDLRQIKLFKSIFGDMMSTKSEEKVATHLTEKVILDKSNC